MTSRRRLAASTLPMLLAVAAAPRVAFAKSAGSEPVPACRDGIPCHAGKSGLRADDGGAGPCPFCAGLAAAGKK
ncbi:hypothetical protein [Neoroseomonas oryzicola]|nr:hypothetical protein [Neoroseomonas oryzicola]NKE15610.1 hypothetical protein [Neoroseomonas oryzicola]